MLRYAASPVFIFISRRCFTLLRNYVWQSKAKSIAKDDDNGLLTPVQNKYGVFDNSRINGTYTMITSMRIPYDTFGYMGYYEPDWYRYIKRVKLKARIRLMSISKMQYFYLKALNTFDSVDYDDYFNLPIRFPSNIEGGTGIFGISIADEAVIPLEDYIPGTSNY